jgi:hypothetical protein
MAELERIEENPDKLSAFQKKYNVDQKNIVHVLGKNLTLFICMLLPLLLIGFVWVDFKEIIIDTKMFSDGIITVMLFTVGELKMINLGSEGGKLSEDYVEARGAFNSVLEEVGKVGTMLMGVFCDWQIDVELEQAIHFRLRLLRISPRTWDEIKDMTPAELEEKSGKKKAKKLLKIMSLTPIELNEAILLYNGEYVSRGGVPVSADAYLKSKKNIAETVIACIFTGLLTVTVVVTLTSDITFARVIYTIFKLTMLLFRMAKGYDKGARAYNIVEVRQFKAKTKYLREYLSFIEDKTYLRLGDKYGDISAYINE